MSDVNIDPAMAIPNVKRFRPFCPTCNDTFTLMAVLPNQANVDAYLADAVTRHDHKAFKDAKLSDEQSSRRSAETGQEEVVQIFSRALSDLRARNPSCATSPSVSLLVFSKYGIDAPSPLAASTRESCIFSSRVPCSSGLYKAFRTVVLSRRFRQIGGSHVP